ncbi:MAG: alpha/beta hydrolase [Firmicutes bacterium]|nr:alpha/beta hydrolase [Bacillota bacterium]
MLPFFSSFRCLVPAMPMDWPDGAMTLEGYAKFIERYLDAHGVKRCHIVAHSFGARITALLVQRNPSRYGKLVLTGAAGVRKKSVRRWMRVRFNKLFRKPGSVEYRGLCPHGKQTFNHIVNRDLRPDIKLIMHEVLLIFGEHDTATPVRHGRIWNRLVLGSRLKVYKKAGHFAYIDQPLRFVNDVLTFLG